MGKKGDKAKTSAGSQTSSFRVLMRRKIRRRMIPISLGSTLAISTVLCIMLNEYGVVQMSQLENLLMFFIFPLLIVLLMCLFASERMTNVVHDKYDEINDTVQRLAMGHYKRFAPEKKSEELEAVFSGLNSVAGKLMEKDSRIESIGRKCDQLESAHEGETCRWLGTKVDPEMIKTVLTGLEIMAQEGRCSDMLEILDDAKQVLAASLEDGTAPRPLADELSRIKRYLEIYEAVYQCRIGYRMSIMCNIVNYRIIPNLVLPVVQILFNRAMESKCDDYEIGVEVNSSFTNLLIIVRDNNGHSVQDEFSYMVNDDTTSRDSEDGPITIGALNRRVSSFYGKKYSIKLSSNKLGTAVYIYLPPISGNSSGAKI